MKENPTTTADAPYKMRVEYCEKQVDVSVQAYQSVATPSGQQTDKLLWMMVQVMMLNVDPEHVAAMMLPHCARGFFPGMEPFMNSGSSTNRQVIHDRSRYQTVMDELR